MLGWISLKIITNLPMKKIISAAVFSVTTFASAQNLDLIRKNYQKAVEDKQVCKEMIFQFEKKNNTGIELAYFGAFQAVWAKHTNNPFEKLNTFNKAKKNIEKALQQEPDQLETIFIRYSVQKESPAFLGYKNNLKDDKNLLSRNIDNISNPFLKDMIIQILKS